MPSALKIVQKYHPNVTKVVDAKHNTRIDVTEKDCKTSKTKAPDSCAMATAFCRKHDGAIISLAIAYLVDGNKATRYRVPGSVSREIISFDRGQYFAPGTYNLLAPVSTEKLSVIRSQRAHPPKKTGVPTARMHKTTGIRTL